MDELPSGLVASATLQRRPPHDVEYAGVADDDGDAGREKGHHEQELLGTAARDVGQDRAGADGGVEAEAAPLLEPGWYEGAEAADPRRQYHQPKVPGLVQSATWVLLIFRR